jgi:hypothetical protein
LGEALLAGESGDGGPQHQETGLSRNLSEDGERVFFQTPDPLVAADSDTGVNPTCVPRGGGVIATGCDVYEWEAVGEGSCESEAQDGGCLYLISGGTSSEQSYFLDASADGDDVFFFTREALVPTDTDANVDAYDARVDGLEKVKPPLECPPPEVFNPTTKRCQEPECFGEEECLPQPPLPPTFALPSSLTLTGTGNLAPPVEEKPAPGKSAKKLTNAQKLAKSLKACRKKPKKKRAACEKQARHKYAAAKKKGKK